MKLLSDQLVGPELSLVIGVIVVDTRYDERHDGGCGFEILGVLVDVWKAKSVCT